MAQEIPPRKPTARSVPRRVTDPVVLYDIDAAFTRAVYQAARLRAAQIAGSVAAAPPTIEGQALLQRIRTR